MEATIYIDVIFFWEWVMNFFLLWAGGRIAGFTTKVWRLLLGGVLSSFCHCIFLYFFFPKAGGMVLSTTLLLLGLGVSYLPKSPKSILRLLGSTYVASFLMGGGLSVLFTTTNAQTMLGRGMRLNVRFFPWQYLLWGIAISYMLLKFGAYWIESHIRRRRDFCTLYMRKDRKWVEGRMLIDTGNGLKRNGIGVMIVEVSMVLPLFSKETQVALLRGEREMLMPLSFQSLGNPAGALWGIIAEECRLSFGEKTVALQDIYVGIAFEPFTGAYEGLVPPCLIEEEMA